MVKLRRCWLVVRHYRCAAGVRDVRQKVKSFMTTGMPMADAAVAEGLLQDVYGPFKDDDGGSCRFPQPLPEEEAGDCSNGDRRYLWTDAFAVMAYTTLAMVQPERDQYLAAADRLVDAVHIGLGRPRSEQYPMLPSPSSEYDVTGFVGLRIGKKKARQTTDLGMRYDGMYWHYIDKWLFALLRLGQVSGDKKRLHQAARIAKATFPHFYDPEHGGFRWKINSDCSPIDDTPHGRFAIPNDDALSALIVFKLIHHAGGKPSLEREINALSNSLQSFIPRVTSDPLGWGLDAWMDQWTGGIRETKLRKRSREALNEAHFALPFRLYGAMLGAKFFPDMRGRVEGLIPQALRIQEMLKRENADEHSSINRVMLACAILAPEGVWRKRPDEPVVPTA